MHLATRNVNPTRTRVGRVLAFLKREDIDALAIQKIKRRPDQFPVEPFETTGYKLTIYGFNQWNGVAIASCVGLGDIAVSFPNQPTWVAKPGAEPVAGAWVLGATADTASDTTPVRLWSLHVPNGRELAHPHYTYKLDWPRVPRDDVAAWPEVGPDLPLALVSDWSVAPHNEDVWNMSAFESAARVSGPEHETFAVFAEVGIRGVTCEWITSYTYWDYQKLRFPRNEGMCVGFVYTSPALVGCVTDVVVDRDERKDKGASDRVPVIVEVS